MSVMSIGGRSPDKPLFSAHVPQQLPLLNADNDIVPGSLAATTDDSHLRTYALEPDHETDLAFAFGHRTVGVLDLLSGTRKSRFSGVKCLHIQCQRTPSMRAHQRPK